MKEMNKIVENVSVLNKLVKQAKGIQVESTVEDKKSDFNEY